MGATLVRVKVWDVGLGVSIPRGGALVVAS